MKNTVKIFALLLCLVLALPLVVSVSAEVGNAVVDWDLSDDGRVLTGNGKTYTKYNLNKNDEFYAEEIFIYEESIEYKDIYRPALTDEIILHGYEFLTSVDGVFVTETGKKILDNFMKGEFNSYLLRDYSGSISKLHASVVAELENYSKLKKVTVDVIELGSAECYEILGLDVTESFAHVHGAIYRRGEKLYYVNYDELGNSYFDSNGKFSYRSGKVTLYELDESLEREIGEAVEDLDAYSPLRTREEVNTFTSDAAALSTFIFNSVLLGYVFPAVPMTFGLVHGFAKKSNNPARWFILAGFSALWMLLATVIILLLVL